MVNSGYVKKTNENGTAVVVFKRESACGGNCASCSGCAASEIEAVALNQVGAVQGDYVTVESETKSVLFSAFVLYTPSKNAKMGTFNACGINEEIVE